MINIPLLGRLLSYNKKRKTLKFQQLYRKYDYDYLCRKVLEYWEKYRFFGEIREIIDFNDKKRILDVGCGITSILLTIKGERHGIDPYMDYYKKMYNLPKEIVWKTGKGENIPYPDAYFDIVICSNVLDHVENPIKVISEIKRVLKSNGLFLLTVDTGRIKTNVEHPHTFSERDIIELLNMFNFVIIFKKKTNIAAQFYRFIENKPLRTDRREVIIISRRSE